MGETNIMQQMTGVRLFNEDKRILNENEYLRLKENIEMRYRNESERQVINKEICEIYFDSSLSMENQPEQFMIAIEKQGKNKKFLLKRRNKVGNYESEKRIKITKKEYRDIIQGSFEWMKESKKVLINEFYCKMKLFQFKISRIMKCYREEIYMKYEQMLVIFNKEIKEYSGGNSVLNTFREPKKILVTVRYHQSYDNQENEKNALESYM